MSKSLTAGVVLATWAALSLSSCVTAEKAASPEAACSLTTARVTAHRGLPITFVAFCDNIPEAEGPGGYYILALHAQCHEEVCGSTNMGWFAVKKATGKLFEWDVPDWKLGPPIPEHR